jgi:hypothetical protein
MLAQAPGQIGVRSAGELHGQMSVRAERAQDVDAERSAADVNADIAVGQFEGVCEIGDIQRRLRAGNYLAPVVLAGDAGVGDIGVFQPSADRVIVFDGNRLFDGLAIAGERE